MTYSEKDCIDELNRVADKLGKSPTLHEYNNLDTSPSSATTIVRRFGSWDSAKKAAGLELNSSGMSTQLPVPKLLDITKEEWESEAYANHRSRLWRQDKVAQHKMSIGCENCGYDNHPEALQLHHTNPENKEKKVSAMCSEAKPIEKIMKEVKKCQILCANCHAIEEATRVYK